MAEKLCLQWNDFQDNVASAFGSLREDNDFADVTLACEDGKQVKAHKVILAASSPFFQNILKRNKHPHPLIYMRGMKSEDLMAIVDFLYHGEANIFQENLDSFLVIAEELQLKGLMGQTNDGGVVEERTTKKPPTKKEIPVYKTEPHISKLSRPSQTNSRNQIVGNEYDYFSSGTVALSSNCSDDLQALNNDISTMMERTSKTNANGKTIFRCKTCGKEAPHSNDIKKHIEANHLEGISIPCNLCEKTFRSRNALAQHKHYIHKGFKN